MLLRVGSTRPPDDDGLALTHAVGRERFPSQAQSPYGVVLVMADGVRWIARLLYRAVAWGWRKVLRRNLKGRSDIAWQFGWCNHEPVRREDLDALRATGQATTLSVRPPGEVTQRLSDVVVVSVSESTVTIDLPSGEQRTVDLAEMADTDTDGERHRRRMWRRVGLIVDSVGLTR